MHIHRRKALAIGAAAIGAGLLPRRAEAATTGAKQLSFLNLHTGEALRVAYAENGALVPEALREINWTLRDHRTGETHDMSVGLLDLLYDLRAQLETSAPFHVISGYRSPQSNAALHEASSGVATRSLHMSGMAIDIRVPGVALETLHAAALAMRRGGVGFYPSSDFVHVDVGRVRSW